MDDPPDDQDDLPDDPEIRAALEAAQAVMKTGAPDWNVVIVAARGDLAGGFRFEVASNIRDPLDIAALMGFMAAEVVDAAPELEEQAPDFDPDAVIEDYPEPFGRPN